MSCAILNAFDISMATTQLTCAACPEVLRPLPNTRAIEDRRLHMNWVVVTDGNSTRLRMQWNVSRDD
jgi:hypothetical protein